MNFKNIIYCKRCLYPSNHPLNLIFDDNSVERLRIGSDGTLSKYLNSSTIQAAFGGSGQVNGITALPSMAGNPFVVGRDTGTTRSAHFGGHLQFDSGYGIQGTEFSVYGNTSGLYLNSLVSGDNIIFQTHNGSSVGERLRISNDGKVVAGGSGSGYPSRLQSHGAGDLLDLNSTSGAGKIRFYESGSGRFNIETLNGSAGLRFYDSLNGVERLRITSAGRVGINEASPDFDLHITSSNPGIVLEDSTGSSQHGQAIIEQNGDNLKIRQDAGNASSGTGSNISL